MFPPDVADFYPRLDSMPLPQGGQLSTPQGVSKAAKTAKENWNFNQRTAQIILLEVGLRAIKRAALSLPHYRQAFRTEDLMLTYPSGTH